MNNEKKFKDLGYVFKANIIIKALTFFQGIILMYLLSPYDFGIVAISMSFIIILRQFRSIGLVQALIADNSKKLSDSKVGTAFLMKAIISISLFILAFFASSHWATFFDEPAIGDVIIFLSLAFLLQIFSFVPMSLLRRELLFSKIFVIESSQNLIKVLTTLYFAFSGYSYWSVVYGQIIGYATLVFLANFYYPYRYNFVFNFNQAKSLFSFGKWVILTSLSLSFLTIIDTTLIGNSLGIIVVGIYSISKRWSNFTLLNVTPVIQKVIFPTLSISKENKLNITKTFYEMIHLVAIFSFPIALGLVSLSQEFIELLSYEKWGDAILPMQILALAGLFRSLQICDPFYYAMNKPNFSFYVVFFPLIMMLLSLPFSISVGGLVSASVAITLIFFFSFIYSIFLLKKLIKIEITNIIKELFFPFLSSLIMLSLIFLVKIQFDSIFNTFTPLVSFFILFLLGFFSYLISFRLISKQTFDLDVKHFKTMIK